MRIGCRLMLIWMRGVVFVGFAMALGFVGFRAGGGWSGRSRLAILALAAFGMCGLAPVRHDGKW